MDLRQLRYFAAVARHGSISVAAQAVHIAQPALTRQMQALGVPGIGIAVVERGELTWTRGFGVLQAGRDARVDDDTLFEMA